MVVLRPPMRDKKSECGVADQLSRPEVASARCGSSMRLTAPSGFAMEEAPAACSVVTDTSAVAPREISHRELRPLYCVCYQLGNGRFLSSFPPHQHICFL